VPEAEKNSARAKLAFWMTPPKKSRALGQKWGRAKEVDPGQTDARNLIDQAIVAVQARTIARRSNCSRKQSLDSSGTEADFLLGVLYAIRGRDVQHARKHFAECVRREPEDAAALK